MTYVEQFETELAKMLASDADTDAIVRWASEKVLESYRNGIKAGKGGAEVIRNGASRRRGVPPQGN